MQSENREIHPGCYYRHFKGGIYQVIGIATHTETGEKLVVYQAQYGQHRLFVRPYQMFAERLNKEEYPETTQEYRFELIDK